MWCVLGKGLHYFCSYRQRIEHYLQSKRWQGQYRLRNKFRQDTIEALMGKSRLLSSPQIEPDKIHLHNDKTGVRSKGQHQRTQHRNCDMIHQDTIPRRRSLEPMGNSHHP